MTVKKFIYAHKQAKILFDQFIKLIQASTQGLKQSQRLLSMLKEHSTSLLQLDYLAIINLVHKIHDQNPRIDQRELPETLIKVNEIIE